MSGKLVFKKISSRQTRFHYVKKILISLTSTISEFKIQTTLALGRKKQEYQEFRASLGFTVSPCLTVKNENTQKGQKEKTKIILNCLFSCMF